MNRPRQVYVELPTGWGDARIIIGAWERAGYAAEEERHIATGERRLLIRGAGNPSDAPAESDKSPRPK